ncbi:MAG: 2Fe-2S iron-sulfur cluster-binding protein [Acidimicrobiia bacterium]
MALFTVTVGDDGGEVVCPDTTNLLEGLEGRGSCAVPVGCRRGGCGVCRVQVLSGTYTALKMSRAHVNADELASGIVLSCRIVPTSDLNIVPRPKATASYPQEK